MTLITGQIVKNYPGTKHLKIIGDERKGIVLCDEHRDFKSMFKILVDDELVTVCGQCFFEEIDGERLGEAKLKNENFATAKDLAEDTMEEDITALD